MMFLIGIIVVFVLFKIIGSVLSVPADCLNSIADLAETRYQNRILSGNCPHCNKVHKLRVLELGQSFACSSCGNVIVFHPVR